MQHLIQSSFNACLVMIFFFLNDNRTLNRHPCNQVMSLIQNYNWSCLALCTRQKLRKFSIFNICIYMYYIICDKKPEEFITKINQKKKSIKTKIPTPPKKNKTKNKTKQTNRHCYYMIIWILYQNFIMTMLGHGFYHGQPNSSILQNAQ